VDAEHVVLRWYSGDHRRVAVRVSVVIFLGKFGELRHTAEAAVEGIPVVQTVVMRRRCFQRKNPAMGGGARR